MRIHAMTVTKNEARRYLEPMLRWTQTFTDGVYVYDDQSDDATRDIVAANGIAVERRPDGVPSFLEDEGEFRECAWRWMESAAGPKDGDWVIVLDADEFFVDPAGERPALEEQIRLVTEKGGDGLWFEVPEIFAVGGGQLFKRIDGYWNTIRGYRLIKWRPNSFFRKKGFACPPVPEGYCVGKYTRDGHDWWKGGSHILHLGYADPEDVKVKYERYKAMPGHNPVHVNSIIRPGRLEVWEGRVPEWI